jgi:hypothetical protein
VVSMALNDGTAGRRPGTFGWRVLAGLFEDAWARERRRRRWLPPLALLVVAAVFAGTQFGGGNGSSPGAYAAARAAARARVLMPVPPGLAGATGQRAVLIRRLASEARAHPQPVSSGARTGFRFFDRPARYRAHGWTFAPAVLTSLPIAVLAMPIRRPTSGIDVAGTELVRAPNGSTFWFVPGSNSDCLFSPDGAGTCSHSLASIDQYGIENILQSAAGMEKSEVVGFVPNANKTLHLGLTGGSVETVPVVNNFYIAPSQHLCQYNVIGTTGLVNSWNVRSCGSRSGY